MAGRRRSYDGRRLLAWSLPNRTSPVGFHRAQALDLLGQFQMIQGDLTAAWESVLRARRDARPR
jgi:hypothetical protein